MSGGVILLIAALGISLLLSVLLGLLSRTTSRSEKPFSEDLDLVVARSGAPVGPSSGVTNLQPMSPDHSLGDMGAAPPGHSSSQTCNRRHAGSGHAA